MNDLLSRLLELQRIPDAYKNWREYRLALTEFLTRYTEPGSTVLIVGAGRCSDFDLRCLEERFSRILLLDRDGSAMREGILEQGADAEKVIPVRADLLGVSDADYQTLFFELREEAVRRKAFGASDNEGFGQTFLDLMKKTLSARRPDDELLSELNTDYVVCCGVHSQMLSLFAEAAIVFGRALPFRTEPVFSFLHSENETVARELNGKLFASAKKGVFLGLETERISMPGGIEGAAQAIADLDEQKGGAFASTEMLWPFDPARNKYYRMSVRYYRLNG